MAKCLLDVTGTDAGSLGDHGGTHGSCPRGSRKAGRNTKPQEQKRNNTQQTHYTHHRNSVNSKYVDRVQAGAREQGTLALAPRGCTARGPRTSKLWMGLMAGVIADLVEDSSQGAFCFCLRSRTWRRMPPRSRYTIVRSRGPIRASTRRCRCRRKKSHCCSLSRRLCHSLEQRKVLKGSSRCHEGDLSLQQALSREAPADADCWGGRRRRAALATQISGCRGIATLSCSLEKVASRAMGLSATSMKTSDVVHNACVLICDW